MNEVKIGKKTIRKKDPLWVIAGPCVIETRELTLSAAGKLRDIFSKADLPFIFKCSFDKANRTSVSSFRGPGLDKGLDILAEVKSKFGVPVLSDIHCADQVKPAAEVLDVLQIPALLCRQTDLILAASETGKPVNIKKGQFLAPWDMKNIVEKFVSTGNRNLLLTERGTSFGYNSLVVDFRSIPVLQGFGYPVFFDATHSVQLPGGLGVSSGGQREFAEPLARAAAATGVNGIFMEVHPEPERALCDGPNMIPIDLLPEFLKTVREIHTLVQAAAPGKRPVCET